MNYLPTTQQNAIKGIRERIRRYGFAPISESDKETFLAWCIGRGIPFWEELRRWQRQEG